MKITKKKATLIGLASSVLFNTAACGRNNEPNVYGPPNQNVTTDINLTQTVYGPPEDFTATDTEITTEDNVLEDVYGPPEDFGITEAPDIEDTEDIDAPDIEENAIPTVYGPPEMFTEE